MPRLAPPCAKQVPWHYFAYLRTGVVFLGGAIGRAEIVAVVVVGLYCMCHYCSTKSYDTWGQWAVHPCVYNLESFTRIPTPMDCFPGSLRAWVCVRVFWTPCTTQNHSLEKLNHMDNVTKQCFPQCFFSTACLLTCFGCICFVFVFLQRAVAAAWQQPIREQGEGSWQMQNPSLLLLGVNQTSDTPGSFGWQIRALGANHRERKQHYWWKLWV